MTCFACVLFVAWIWNRRGFAESESNSTLIFKHRLDKLLINGSYDRNIRPLYDVGKPVQITVDIVLNTLGPVTEREMELSASFYLQQQWRDPRLAFAAVNQTVLLSHHQLSAIWTPDIHFSQSKHEHRHDVTVPNILIQVHPDGTIFFSQRLTVTFQCLMDLRKFPMDEQTCYIRMESYSHTTDDMFFTWRSERESFDILENAHIPDFKLNEIISHDCTATYATGTYPCLEAQLKLERQIGFYMTQTYVPCALIVSLSWVSFWLDTHAIPARISVGLLTVLTITTQSSGVRSELPRVPYTKAIDVWISVCLIFVFAAYMEYAVVAVFSRRHRKSNTSAVHSDPSLAVRTASSGEAEVLSNGVSRSCSQNSQQIVNGNNDSDATIKRKATASKSPSSRATLRPCRQGSFFQLDHQSRDIGHVVDKWSRASFPLAFFLFNLGYWLYYTQSA